MPTRKRQHFVILSCLFVAACGDDAQTDGSPDSGPDADSTADVFDSATDDARIDGDDGLDAGDDTDDAESSDSGEDDSDGIPDSDGLPPILEVPPSPDHTPSVNSMSKAFQLYYRERVERVLVAYNRYALFGDATFATNIGNAYVAANGDELEIIPGPKDNNLIGTGTWMAYNAYRIFRSRALELTLLRQLEGLLFYEAVTGHAGLTSREVYPGWTRVVNGVSGTVTRTRFGEPITPPIEISPELEAEIVTTFFDGITVTYRENPAEFLFNFSPAARPEDYAITHSFSELPDFLRVSNCCSSLKRTPEPHTWAGAFWGNHNSRDNFPDLAQGLVAAMAAAHDEDASEEVRAAALRVVEASHRIGDLILDNEVCLMTVDEFSSYDVLTIGGTIRPHGDPENQDLGSLGVCAMGYLAQALSSRGLASPVPELPLPHSGDKVMFDDIDWLVDCELPEGDVVCRSINDAFCGREWSNFHRLLFLGQPIFEFLEDNPELGPALLAGFQNDFDDVAEGTLIIAHYARITGDDALFQQARETVFYMTWLMQELADLAFVDDPDNRAEYRFRAALYRAQADLPVTVEDLEDFARPEAQTAALESLVDFADTSPAPLMTDEEIATRIESELEGTRDSVVNRYRDEYGETPPLRRSDGGYEARGTPVEDYPWQTVEIPRHRRIGNLKLFHAIPLCHSAPDLLDCTWARLGCSRPDLDGNGEVDEADQTLFDAAAGVHADGACGDDNSYCDGADLDRDGAVTDLDRAFLVAALGCWY